MVLIFYSLALVDERLMRPFGVAKREVMRQRLVQFEAASLVFEIDKLVPGDGPKPLDKAVVEYATQAIHADILVAQHVGKCRARKLPALVAVEDLRSRSG